MKSENIRAENKHRCTIYDEDQREATVLTRYKDAPIQKRRPQPREHAGDGYEDGDPDPVDEHTSIQKRRQLRRLPALRSQPQLAYAPQLARTSRSLQDARPKEKLESGHKRLLLDLPNCVAVVGQREPLLKNLMCRTLWNPKQIDYSERRREDDKLDARHLPSMRQVEAQKKNGGADTKVRNSFGKAS